MAIYEVTDTEILQRCGKCNAENRIGVTALKVGVAFEAQTDARTIPLPPCPGCGSTEFLIRSPDDEAAYPSPGSFGHLHRMLVDELHAKLVEADRVIAPLLDAEGRTDQKLARPLPQASRDRWFPTGMKSAAPKVEIAPAPKRTVSPEPSEEELK